MALWRCENARCWETTRPGYDFEADQGVCPKCGADRDDPITARYVTRRAIIHFDPPHPTIDGLGIGYPICGDERHVSILHLSYATSQVLEQASGEPNAVTCPACLASPLFPTKARQEPENTMPPTRSQAVARAAAAKARANANARAASDKK